MLSANSAKKTVANNPTPSKKAYDLAPSTPSTKPTAATTTIAVKQVFAS